MTDGTVPTMLRPFSSDPAEQTVATVLNVSKTTAYGLLAPTGPIPAERYGRCKRASIDDVIAFKRASRVPIRLKPRSVVLPDAEKRAIVERAVANGLAKLQRQREASRAHDPIVTKIVTKLGPTSPDTHPKGGG